MRDPLWQEVQDIRHLASFSAPNMNDFGGLYNIRDNKITDSAGNKPRCITELLNKLTEKPKVDAALVSKPYNYPTRCTHTRLEMHIRLRGSA